MMPILKSTRRHQPAGQNARGSAAPTSLVVSRHGAVGALSSMASSRSTPPSRASGHDWSGTDLDLAAELAAPEQLSTRNSEQSSAVKNLSYIFASALMKSANCAG